MMSAMIVVVFLLIAGCLNYKAYDLPKEDSSAPAPDDASLVDEIAQIEKELQAEQPGTEPANPAPSEENIPPAEESAPAPEEVSGEVILPDLKEETVAPDKMPSTETSQTITVDENELIKLSIKVTDPDKDNVTYTFSAPLDKNGEWKTNYGDAGEYVVSIKASDGKLTTEKAVKIIVNRVNVPPVIEAVKDLRVKEGATVTFTPNVQDPNQDKVTVSITAPLASGKFVTDHTSAGEYRIKVTASDGELESEKSFLLTVDDVNVPPEVTNLKDITVKEGETVTIKPIINDVDEDTIVTTISDPVGNDGVWETAFTDHAVYLVKVTVSDGKDTVIKNINLIVEDVNMPPEIVDVSLQKK